MVAVPSPSQRRRSSRNADVTGADPSTAESSPNRSSTKPRANTERRRKARQNRRRIESVPAAASSSKASDTPTETAPAVGNTDLSSLSLFDLHTLVDDAVAEIKRRRMEDQDVETLIDYGFQNCFTTKGAATSPVVVNGMVVIPGSVQVKNRKGDHDCNLFTARIAGEDKWVWDFPEHSAGSRTFKDGDLRRTVTVFPAIDGMIVFGHDRRRSNTKGSAWPVHTYKSGGATALKLVMDDDVDGHFEIAPPIDIRNLPLPSGIEDGE